MAKKRIKGTDTPDNKNKSAHLPEFKKRPKAQKGLFSTVASSRELSPADRHYFTAVEILKRAENGDLDSPSLLTIGNFFRVQCEFEYGTASADSNHFNMLNTFEKVMLTYKLNQLEVLQLVAKTFVVFPEVVRELNLTDVMPSISLFKRQFIVERILNFNGKKFNTFH